MHLTLDSESDGHLPNGVLSVSTVAHSAARRARTELHGLRGGVDGGQHWQGLFQTNTHTNINVHTDGKNISGNNAIFIYEDKKKKKRQREPPCPQAWRAR